MAVILLIEDRPWRSAGEATVRDASAARAAERGAGEPRCKASWGGPRILDRRFVPAGTLRMTETSHSLHRSVPLSGGRSGRLRLRQGHEERVRISWGRLGGTARRLLSQRKEQAAG